VTRYMENTNIFNCPANGPKVRWNIGINLNIAPNATNLSPSGISRVTQVVNPSATIYYADASLVDGPSILNLTNADLWVANPTFTGWVHFRTEFNNNNAVNTLLNDTLGN